MTALVEPSWIHDYIFIFFLLSLKEMKIKILSEPLKGPGLPSLCLVELLGSRLGTRNIPGLRVIVGVRHPGMLPL